MLSNQEQTQAQIYQAIEGLTTQIAAKLMERGWSMATAESCTGGMIAAACTDLSGSSNWFERGWVTYSNAAKSIELGVPKDVIAQHGAVSEPVARAMAAGALQHAPVQVAVAVTGVAGPTGGRADKPVGTVWFGWATPAGIVSEVQHFVGDRAAVRTATVLHALQKLLTLIA